MENTQNNLAGYSSGNNKKIVWTTIVMGIVALGALMWWLKQVPTSQQVQASPTPDAEAAAINQSVDSVNVEDLNAELNAIDTNIQGL
jgi:hypothetical protein